MATATPNKTGSVEVIVHQAATHPTTIVGSAIDCRTKMAATLFLYHGYVEAAADTNPGSFKVQVRPDAGDGAVLEHWITVFTGTAKGTTPDTEAMTATVPSQPMIPKTLTAALRGDVECSVFMCVSPSTARCPPTSSSGTGRRR